MKIRLKYKNRKAIVDSEGTHTLEHLQTLATSNFQLLQDCNLSLNGKDILDGNDRTLNDLGLVSGDLVWVLSEAGEEVQNQVQPQNVVASCSGSSGTPVSQHANTAASSTEDKSSGTTTSHCVSHDSASNSNAISRTSDMLGEDANRATAAASSVEPDVEAVRDDQVNLYLREPGLIQESSEDQVPQTLVEALKGAGVQNAAEAVFVVLHMLMHESGYCHLNQGSTASANVENVLTESYDLGSDWRTPGSYRLQYSHPRCVGIRFLLNCVPVGPVMIVHGRAEHDTSEPIICQLQVKPSNYIRTPVTGSDCAHTLYKKLSTLSRLFKDSIAHHLLHSYFQEQGMVEATTLEGLLTELKLKVLQYLNVRDLLRTSATCHEFRDLVQNKQLWRRLYLRDFGRRQDNSLDQDWKKMYTLKYVERKRIQEHQRFLMQPFGVLPRPQPPPFGPVYPPGYIGGDYDRDPFVFGQGGGVGILPGRPGVGIGMPRPRFDPIGPLPSHRFPPGRGGGMWDQSSRRGFGGGFSSFGRGFF